MSKRGYANCSRLELGRPGTVWVHGFEQLDNRIWVVAHTADGQEIDTEVLSPDELDPYIATLYRAKYCIATIETPQHGTPIHDTYLYNMIDGYHLDYVSYTYDSKQALYVPRHPHHF